MSYESIFGIILIVFASIFYVNLDAQTVQPKPKKVVANVPKAPKIDKQPHQICNWNDDGSSYFNNGEHSVNLKKGQVIVDGKIIKLPSGDSAKIAFHQTEMKKLSEQMQPLQEKIQKLKKL